MTIKYFQGAITCYGLLSCLQVTTRITSYFIMNNFLTFSLTRRTFICYYSQSTLQLLSNSHFASSAFEVDNFQTDNQTVTLKSKVMTYHDSLAQLLLELGYHLETREIKSISVSVIKTSEGPEIYFRTLVVQILCTHLLEEISNHFPELMIHHSSNPLSCMVNTCRFFINYLMNPDNSRNSQDLVDYLLKLVVHLQKGTIAKGIKPKALLVPSAGVLKISGHKFLCLSSLREIQKIKDSSHFALISNYSMMVFLGIIFENWNIFQKYLNTRPTGNYDSLQEDIRLDLNTLVFPTLSKQLDKIQSVKSRAQKLGQSQNSSPKTRVNDNRAKSAIKGSTHNGSDDFLRMVTNLELLGEKKNLIRAVHYILYGEVIIFDSEYRIFGENKTMVVLNYENFKTHYDDFESSFENQGSKLFVLPSIFTEEMKAGYRFAGHEWPIPYEVIGIKDIKKLISRSHIFHHRSMMIRSEYWSSSISKGFDSHESELTSFKTNYIENSLTPGIKECRHDVLRRQFHEPVRPVLMFIQNGYTTYYVKDLESNEWRINSHHIQPTIDINRNFPFNFIHGIKPYISRIISNFNQVHHFQFREKELSVLKNTIGVIGKEANSLKKLAEYANVLYTLGIKIFLEGKLVKGHFLEQYSHNGMIKKLSSGRFTKLPIMLMKGQQIKSNGKSNYIVDTYVRGQFLRNQLEFFIKNPHLMCCGYEQSFGLLIEDYSKRVISFTFHEGHENQRNFIKISYMASIHLSYKLETQYGHFHMPAWLLKIIRNDFLFHELKKLIYSQVSDIFTDIVKNPSSIDNMLSIRMSYRIMYDFRSETFELLNNNSCIVKYKQFNLKVFGIDIIISHCN